MNKWISTAVVLVATGVESAQRGMIAQPSGWWERKEIDLFYINQLVTGSCWRSRPSISKFTKAISGHSLWSGFMGQCESDYTVIITCREKTQRYFGPSYLLDWPFRLPPKGGGVASPPSFSECVRITGLDANILWLACYNSFFGSRSHRRVDNARFSTNIGWPGGIAD